MADELRKTLGVESKLVAGSGGVFEVTADGKTIFERSTTGRFPDKGEVLKALQR